MLLANSDLVFVVTIQTVVGVGLGTPWWWLVQHPENYTSSTHQNSAQMKHSCASQSPASSLEVVLTGLHWLFSSQTLLPIKGSSTSACEAPLCSSLPTLQNPAPFPGSFSCFLLRDLPSCKLSLPIWASVAPYCWHHSPSSFLSFSLPYGYVLFLFFPLPVL